MKFNPILNGARVFFGISLLLIFSTATFSQLNNNIFQKNINFLSGSENISSKLRTRPRIYVEPVKPSTENAEPLVELPKTLEVSFSTLDLERQAFELLNQRRIENGLKPVIWSDDVARVARIHSQNMAKNNFFSHQGLDGLMVNDRADSLGIRNWRSIGENIAYNRGYKNPVEFAVLRWMQSQSHRENLLSNKWKETGVGVALAPDGKTYYFTQVFMSRK